MFASLIKRDYKEYTQTKRKANRTLHKQRCRSNEGKGNPDAHTSGLRPAKTSARIGDEGTSNCLDIFLAIILPPLGVFAKFGCKEEFWVCLLLTILGYLPGVIYAIYVITKKN